MKTGHSILARALALRCRATTQERQDGPSFPPATSPRHAVPGKAVYRTVLAFFPSGRLRRGSVPYTHENRSLDSRTRPRAALSSHNPRTPRRSVVSPCNQPPPRVPGKAVYRTVLAFFPSGRWRHGSVPYTNENRSLDSRTRPRAALSSHNQRTPGRSDVRPSHNARCPGRSDVRRATTKECQDGPTFGRATTQECQDGPTFVEPQRKSVQDGPTFVEPQRKSARTVRRSSRHSPRMPGRSDVSRPKPRQRR